MVSSKMRTRLLSDSSRSRDPSLKRVPLRKSSCHIYFEVDEHEQVIQILHIWMAGANVRRSYDLAAPQGPVSSRGRSIPGPRLLAFAHGVVSARSPWSNVGP